MRADAARNLDAIVQTAARLLAEDPGTSLTAIAAEAGVSRHVVYRRFENREALRDAVFHTKLDAVDVVLGDARLDSAPVAVALHRFVEGIIAVDRHYPVGPDQMRCDDEGHGRMVEQREQVATFIRRAMDERLIRSDLPDGIVHALLYQIIALLARQLRDHDPARTADIVVDTFLRGVSQN